jgi:hypothetical protein
MDGVETLRELCVSVPTFASIASGYAEHDIASRFAGMAPNGFIQNLYHGSLRRSEKCPEVAV